MNINIFTMRCWNNFKYRIFKLQIKFLTVHKQMLENSKR